MTAEIFRAAALFFCIQVSACRGEKIQPCDDKAQCHGGADAVAAASMLHLVGRPSQQHPVAQATNGGFAEVEIDRAFTSPSSKSSPNETEVSFLVGSSPYWNSGPKVIANQTYTLEVIGEQTWTDWYISTSACGFDSWLHKLTKRFGNRRVRTEPIFKLMCAFDGDPKSIFPVGKSITRRAEKNGSLTCFANDDEGAYLNNCGSLTVTCRGCDEMPERQCMYEDKKLESTSSFGTGIEVWETCKTDRLNNSQCPWGRTPWGISSLKLGRQQSEDDGGRCREI